MNSQTIGEHTSTPEVTHIDRRGFWLFIDGHEHHLPFEVFPWFADANIRQITTIQQPRPDLFHWPELDVDLTLDMIDHPENYPKRYKT